MHSGPCSSDVHRSPPNVANGSDRKSAENLRESPNESPKSESCESHTQPNPNNDNTSDTNTDESQQNPTTKAYGAPEGWACSKPACELCKWMQIVPPESVLCLADARKHRNPEQEKKGKKDRCKVARLGCAHENCRYAHIPDGVVVPPGVCPTAFFCGGFCRFMPSIVAVAEEDHYVVAQGMGNRPARKCCTLRHDVHYPGYQYLPGLTHKMRDNEVDGALCLYEAWAELYLNREGPQGADDVAISRVCATEEPP